MNFSRMPRPMPILQRYAERTFPVVVLLIGIAGGLYTFTLSYVSHTNVVIGLLLLPFTVFVNGDKRSNYVYLILIVILGVLALTYKVRICYFFLLLFYLLWIIERFVGRCNPLILFLFVFMSPFFSQVAAILGFPVRMKLSYLAGTFLRSAGFDIQVEGNMLVLDGAMFTVDEACMGLNMLALSMLMGIFIIAHRYRSSGKQLNLVSLSIFFSLVFLLNMMTNLARIIALVLFRILPKNPMHDFIGLLCITIYVVVPCYVISAWLIRKYGQTSAVLSGNNEMRPRARILLVTFALGVFAVGAGLGQKRSHVPTVDLEVSIPNATNEELNDGITKISNDNLLVYVKPIAEFFSAEHTPLICWKGSGYEFDGVREITINGKTIYSGRLVRDNEELHTAWWYSNGTVQTISQTDWRLRMFYGERRFCLVNITARDHETLMASIPHLITSTMVNTK